MPSLNKCLDLHLQTAPTCVFALMIPETEQMSGLSLRCLKAIERKLTSSELVASQHKISSFLLSFTARFLTKPLPLFSFNEISLTPYRLMIFKELSLEPSSIIISSSTV